MAGARGKKRKQKRPTKGKAQSARFTRMAGELGIDPDAGAFGLAMDLLFPPKSRKGRPKP
jgi:hypothetical protein